jgi:hypothetical protein
MVIIDQTKSITTIIVINSNAEIDVFSEDIVRHIEKKNKDIEERSRTIISND